VVIAADVGPQAGELAVSAVTVSQLHFGVLVTQEPAVRAESYGQLAAAVLAAGRRPRPRVMDLLIAATAHAHDARLYTRNATDLVGADELLEVVTV
jgi:predicted nucleic acid-binding protein